MIVNCIARFGQAKMSMTNNGNVLRQDLVFDVESVSGVKFVTSALEERDRNGLALTNESSYKDGTEPQRGFEGMEKIVPGTRIPVMVMWKNGQPVINIPYEPVHYYNDPYDAPEGRARTFGGEWSSCVLLSNDDVVELTIDVAGHGDKVFDGVLVAGEFGADGKPTWKVELGKVERVEGGLR